MIIVRRVMGVSMEPTLHQGKIVVGLRVFRSLKPGHIVVFKHENKELIKRVSKMSTDGIFVVGDHPEHSIDSRHFGPINRAQVIARLVYPKAARRRRKPHGQPTASGQTN